LLLLWILFAKIKSGIIIEIQLFRCFILILSRISIRISLAYAREIRIEVAALVFQ